MNKYPLQRLLEVRKHREDNAKIALTRARQAAEDAQIAAEKVKETAEVYTRERPAREAALFEQIRHKVLPRPEVDAYHEALAAIAAREVELHEAAALARKRQTEAERAVEEAVFALQRASREVRKFEEHRAIWTAEENARLEAAEELEAEETAGLRTASRAEQEV